VTVSGAGPSLLAVCHDRDRRAVGNAMLSAFENHEVDARVYQTQVSDGATLL